MVKIIFLLVSTLYSQNTHEFRDKNNVLKGLIDSSGNIVVYGSTAVVGGSTLTSSGNFVLVPGSTISANGTLTISTAPTAAQSGVPAIFINKSGQVGISTTSPTSALEVGGTLKATNMTLTGTGNVLTMGVTNSGHINMANGNIIGINGLTINDTGIDEGIGWGSSRRISVYESSQGGFPGFVFDTAGGYNFIFQGGNVGLSTSAPTTTLDINGGLWASTGTFVATSTYSIIASSGIQIGGSGGLIAPFVHAGTVTTTGPLHVSGPAIFKSSAVVGGKFGAAGATAADLTVTGVAFFGIGSSYKVGSSGLATFANSSMGDIKNDAANTVDFRIMKTNMSTGKIVIGSGTTNGILVLTSAGNVGIANTAPGSKLDVGGESRFGATMTRSTITATGFMQPRSMTTAQIKAYTPAAGEVGGLVYCSNCSPSVVCVATGTTIQGFCDISSRTLTCK